MNNKLETLNASELILILMKSTGYYVYGRLGSSNGREAYRLAMKECIDVASSGFTNLEIIKTKILSVGENASNLYPTSFFNKRLESYKCHEMAVANALDIVCSIEKRFITGSSDSASRIYKGIGVLNEDKSIFG